MLIYRRSHVTHTTGNWMVEMMSDGPYYEKVQELSTMLHERAPELRQATTK